MIRSYLLPVLLVATMITGAWAHPPGADGKHDHGPDPVKGPNFFFDKADVMIEASVLDEKLAYDADLAVLEKSIWMTWLEYVPGEGDVVWAGLRNDGKWQSRAKVFAKPANFANPTITVDAKDRLWLSYEKQSTWHWDVWLVELVDGKAQGEPRRISPGKGSDIHHCVAADPHGGLWIAWQSDQDGQFDVLARHVTADAMQDVIAVGDEELGEWHPSLTCDDYGFVTFAWDSYYDGKSFNICARCWQKGKLGTTLVIADTPNFEGRPQVVSAGGDRVWIAWEEGGGNWGKPYRPKLTTATMTDQLGPLHRYRHLHVAMIEGDGAVRELTSPLPMPSVKYAADRPGLRKEAKRIGAFYERARLATDERGRLWVAYRHYYTPWLGIKHRSHVEEGWGVYARCLTDQGWSQLCRFKVGQGDGMQSLEIAARGAGIAAVWTTGRTHRDTNKRPRGVAVAAVTIDGEQVESLPLAKPRFPQQPKTDIISAKERDEPVKHNGKQYQLFYGDLHRHTDLSLCRVPIDGTIDDAYRYAIEVAGLDFLGITDHSRDIAKGDALSLLWWRSTKEVSRHEVGTNFFPFFAYERSHGNTADHNVISLRGDMLRPHTYPVPQFWKEIDPATTITIPHQPIRRDTWKYQDDERRPLVEIYQGARDKIIAADVHKGLKLGYHLGFIASSDHMSTSASYACVWAEDASRESIFQAMKARRTYGATANIRLIVQSGKHWMGERVSGVSELPLLIQAEGTAPIRSVELVVDGRVSKTFSPGTREITIKDSIKFAGRQYVYVHLIQADGNHAWSSPIWNDLPTASSKSP